MPTMILRNEHRAESLRNSADEFYRMVKGAQESVNANAGKPRLLDAARSHRSHVNQLFAAYLNTLLVQFAEPDQDGQTPNEFALCYGNDAWNLIPVVSVWKLSYIHQWREDCEKSGRKFDHSPKANPETLVWLLGYVYNKKCDGSRLPILTGEAKSRVQKCAFTDEDVGAERLRLGFDRPKA